MLLVKEGVRLIESKAARDYCWIIVETTNDPITIMAIYSPSLDSMTTTEWYILLDNLLNTSPLRTVVILGDFNLHYRKWILNKRTYYSRVEKLITLADR